mmetsp:Transcript_1623/g.4832  ORF Transcript_1623/g.4832 Transcript_1623/m.4832 type:complete len:288 (+) Transcript_1623:228-1091(+)
MTRAQSLRGATRDAVSSTSNAIWPTKRRESYSTPLSSIFTGQDTTFVLRAAESMTSHGGSASPHFVFARSGVLVGVLLPSLSKKENVVIHPLKSFDPEPAGISNATVSQKWRFSVEPDFAETTKLSQIIDRSRTHCARGLSSSTSKSSNRSIFCRSLIQSSMVPRRVTCGMPHARVNLKSKYACIAAIVDAAAQMSSVGVDVVKPGRNQSLSEASLMFSVISSSMHRAIFAKSVVWIDPKSSLTTSCFSPSCLTNRDRSCSAWPLTYAANCTRIVIHTSSGRNCRFR